MEDSLFPQVVKKLPAFHTTRSSFTAVTTAANDTSPKTDKSKSTTSHLIVEEIQQDATVRRYLFTAKLLYIFRASIAPIIRSI